MLVSHNFSLYVPASIQLVAVLQHDIKIKTVEADKNWLSFYRIGAYYTV